VIDHTDMECDTSHRYGR